ncbi:MAG: MFS transporter [Desulfobacteraceae bacterium]|nr:MFS transporter [Desulfobacteraceae bacterium]
MPKPTHVPPNRYGQRWTIFGIIFSVYFFVYFHRVSTSVIAAELLEDFNTNAASLGFMSSMYFYLYAAEQPLVGYLTDRWGPGRVIGYWSILAAAGCFLFGLSPSIGWASAARGLIGIGVGGVYVPALKALSLWFRKKEFAAMIGVLMSIGNLGAVIATAPLAWASDAWGWRSTFFLIGLITLTLSVACLTLIKDNPGALSNPGSKQPEKSKTGLRSNLIKVLMSARFWTASILFFGIYGTFVTLQGLWSTPYLIVALNIEPLSASKLNMFIPIGVIVGAPLLGWISDRFRIAKNRFLIFILVFYNLTWLPLIFLPTILGFMGFAMLHIVMGIMAGGFISILWGYVRENTASGVLGMTIGLMNPAPIAGVAVFQILTGAILDKAGKLGNHYTAEGFKQAFTFCLLVNLFCLALSFFFRKSKKPK